LFTDLWAKYPANPKIFEHSRFQPEGPIIRHRACQRFGHAVFTPETMERLTDWLKAEYWPDVDVFGLSLREVAEKLKPARKPKRRRRASPKKPVPLTAKQVEAMQLVGEHKGNFTAAGKAAGKTPTAMRKLYNKACAKLGTKTVKHATQRLPEDRRGQATVEDNAD
jgi:hypothetical protein